jgi:hypothetical protein
MSNKKFSYREDAEELLGEAKEDNPNRDFQLVKRTTSYKDEILK